MGQTKRINLSFDLRVKEARKVYNILMSKRSTKTAFVIKVIREYEENNIPITKQVIKDAVKEAIEEVGTMPVPLDIAPGNEKKSGAIPDDVFDIISNL